MIVEIGHFALILALCVAVTQSAVPMIGAHQNNRGWMAVAGPTAVAQLGLLLISFFALMYAYVTSDFSVKNVAANSNFEADDLQDQRRVGKPRRLNAALGIDPCIVRRNRCRLWTQSPARSESAHACRTSSRLRRISSVYYPDVESVRTFGARTD